MTKTKNKGAEGEDRQRTNDTNQAAAERWQAESARRLHTVEEVAVKIAFHPESVRRCIRQQRIHAVKFGDEWRITSDEVNRIFAQGI